MQMLGWTLVFTTASLEHLAERDIDADDVADAVFGRYGLRVSGVPDAAPGPDGSWWLRWLMENS